MQVASSKPGLITCENVVERGRWKENRRHRKCKQDKKPEEDYVDKERLGENKGLDDLPLSGGMEGRTTVVRRARKDFRKKTSKNSSRKSSVCICLEGCRSITQVSRSLSKR